MSTDKLLSCLNKIKQTGKGRWLACCPAHEDKSPSLAITEKDDGRTLIHCFSGCDTEQVLSAVELTFADLMPEPKGNHIKGEKRPFAAADALRAISFEALIVMVCAGDILAGKFSKSDRERLGIAIERIHSALTACGVRYGH